MHLYFRDKIFSCFSNRGFHYGKILNDFTGLKLNKYFYIIKLGIGILVKMIL